LKILSDPGLRQDLKILAGDTTDDLGSILPDPPAQASPNDADAPKNKADYRNLHN